MEQGSCLGFYLKNDIDPRLKQYLKQPFPKVFNNDNSLSIVTGFVFGAINLYAIYFGHFHEDAYILFTYVENLGEGFGICFFPGGEPTEGATDFLWLLILGLLNFLGLNVGLGVVLLNSVSAFVISKTCLSEVYNRSLNRPSLIIGICLTIAWIGISPLKAILGGFSVLPYMAMIIISLNLARKNQFEGWFPIVLLGISLFRPDGLVFSIVLLLVFSNKVVDVLKNRKPRIIYLLCLTLAVVYFLFRWKYFGHLLPLPLYVKSGGGAFVGFAQNFDWIINQLPLIIAFLVFFSLSNIIPSTWKLLIPGLIHFAILGFAHQSQNISFRFQAPIFITLYFITFLSAIELLKVKQKKVSYLLVGSFVVILLVLGLNNLRSSLYSVLNFNYINQFPVSLSTILPNGKKIALTEAGRIPYWTRKSGSHVIDLVGLNTEYPALNKLDKSYLTSLSPDLVMFYNQSVIRKSFEIPAGLQNRTVIMDESILRNVKLDLDNEIFITNEKVPLASLVALEYLKENANDYEIFLVDYNENGTYRHTYGIKKSLGLKEEFQKSLEKSFERFGKKGYLQLKLTRGG